MTKGKANIDWNKIKALYLKGNKPKDIAEQFGIKAKAISDKATSEKWTRKKSQISAKIESTIETDLKEISELCTKELKELLKKDLKPSEKIQAIRLGYDITLLNKNAPEKDDSANDDNFIEALTGQINETWADYESAE